MVFTNREKSRTWAGILFLILVPITIPLFLQLPLTAPIFMHLTDFILPIFRMKKNHTQKPKQKYETLKLPNLQELFPHSWKITALEKELGDAQSLYNKDEEMHTSCSQNCSRKTINKWNIRITPVSRIYRFSLGLLQNPKSKEFVSPQATFPTTSTNSFRSLNTHFVTSVDCSACFLAICLLYKTYINYPVITIWTL